MKAVFERASGLSDLASHIVFRMRPFGPVREVSAPRSARASPDGKIQKGSTPAALNSRATFERVKYPCLFVGSIRAYELLRRAISIKRGQSVGRI